MKKMRNLASVSLMLALTGCGGDSGSSGSYHTVYKQTITNGNVYNCPIASAQQECTTDATCRNQKCELIKEVVVVDTNPTTSNKLCTTLNGQVLVENNKSCRFINQNDNTLVAATCKNNQEIILDGKIKGYNYDTRSFISGANVQTYRFLCD